MKSFCIKTNNEEILSYLIKNLETSSLENVYFSSKEFKCYKNIIVHYLGENINAFLSVLSEILSNTILLFYEPIFIRRLLNYNYFYFDDFEKKIIENNCYDSIVLEENSTLKYRKEEIWSCVLQYLEENKAMILDGFVIFRLREYLKSLEEILDSCVQQYVIEKEYNEFINLLKLYVDSKVPQTSLVHLIYINEESILLDKNKKIVSLDDSIFNATYLSDISFSSNDYALNALLTLLPKKILIHINLGCEDEFINTLKLIFCDRVSICTNCNICKTYQILNNVNF